ncbi:NAD(P)-binding protein [Aulographum hederae CBS 113979]|uniref:NAD(P)-binding protein n=1 Tax=Aulographum hederae CBS 113979 TaxID=1176131 RepID=A0A6G1H8D2_9PEZI|nr:NAD(P)-binding protein [Aulographum hederae CBS 113979]
MNAIKSTIAENIGGKAHKAAAKEHQFDIDADVPDLSGKVAVITGGSEGIGYAAGFCMLRAGLEKLFIISMSKEVADGAVKDIGEKLGEEKAKKVVWLQCDLGDWKKIGETAKKILEQTDRLDILCLNGARGIMTYQLTEYGVDRHIAVNHIGHVILTSHLLPLLKKTATAHPDSYIRIHAQSSNAHQMTPSDTHFASLDELNRDLGPNGQYGRSKLANLLHMRYLARHLTSSHPNILANATHPGFVETKMSSEDIHEPYPIMGYGMSKVMKPFKKDQWMGCASLLFVSTKTEKSGEYVCPPAVPEPGSEMARDEGLGEQLMKLTGELIKKELGEEMVFY